MRLTVSPLTELTPNLLTDIAKLPIPVEREALPEWLEKHDLLWQATFNDKLIALACVEQEAEQYTLSYFAVREATRRRGVGRYLLEQVRHQLAQPLRQHPELPIPTAEQAAWQAFWAAMAH